MTFYKKVLLENHTEHFNNAVDTIKSIDPDYFQSTLEGRLKQSRSGSFFHGFDNTSDLEHHLRNLKWELSFHPDVSGGAIALKAYSPTVGTLGVTKISSLPHNTPIRLVDRKNTGTLSPEVNSEYVPDEIKHTHDVWAVLGGEPYELWTVHPGEPIPPSRLEDKSLENTIITPSEALNYGLSHAKIVD